MRKEDFSEPFSSTEKKINIGDRVRFLNNVGGGIVRAFKRKDLVLVEDDNGFDVPALISECVVVGEAEKKLNEPTPYILQQQKAVEKPKSEVKKEPVYTFTETSQGERLNVHLAFLPVDPKAFMQTAFESYIINESNYYLFINYMSCNNNSWTSKFNGLIEPDTKIFMEEFDKSTLSEYERVCVQMVAFKKNKPYSLKNPYSIELRLDTVKFYKIHCFMSNDFFDEDALVYPLILNDKPEKQLLISATELQEAMYKSKKEERREAKPAIANKNKKDNTPLEIDLHINKLVDTTSGMSNTDILNLQLSRFHEALKTHKRKKGQKIVFIHGKGEGILRTAIEKELKTVYKRQCRFQDASFREYGYGATMVTIL
jgi:hypothetical protein